MIKGTVILVQTNSGNFFSEAIKFFTKKIAKKYRVRAWTHAMIGVGSLLEEDYVFSAEVAQSIMPLKKFQKGKTKFEVYEIKDNIKEKDLEYLIRSFCGTYAGNTYGFFQNLWFIYRWLMELFGKDVRKKANWFPSGDICSEMTFRFLTQRFSYALQNKNNKNLESVNTALKHLYEWTENTIHPVDIGYIISKHPEVFSKISSWNC